MPSLSRQTVLITGAASGLGRALALTLADRGCHLYLVDRDLFGLEELQRQHPMGIVRLFRCDLADAVDRGGLIAAVKADVAALNLLINCAGIGSHSNLQQLSVDEARAVMQVNAVAPLELTVGLYSLLLASGAGGVVNIGSTAGEIPVPSMSVYCASKGALHAFSRAIEMESPVTTVRSLLVILGSLRDTRFAQSIRHPASGQPRWYRRLDASPDRVARAIVNAMERGQNQLIYPGWYGPVLWAAQVLAPMTAAITKAGYARRSGALWRRAQVAQLSRVDRG